ncbi:MAG: metallophosphoesterase family protein [Verrucomicrobia bacterium]|nr:metallophosphoesterase family protein [Verrucomicrobiota bacterium]
MKIGVISDTHNWFDPQVEKLFAGVDHILHAGDVGRSNIIVELEQIAPVTAVYGNTDDGLPLRETEVIELAGRKFMIHHIVDIHNPSETFQRRLLLAKPDVVVFGHTHKPFNQMIGKTLFLNPGSAGKKRFNDPRVVAILHCDANDLRVEFKHLE